MLTPGSAHPARSDGRICGVYCLANDRVLEWFQVFLRSFRHFNPSLPLAIIPYNSEVTEIQKLAGPYSFEVLPESVVAQFDALEPQIMQLGVHAGMFRKWATFFGPYDDFIFFDADIAVTMPLDEIFTTFARCVYDFVYFDTDITQVYQPEYVAEMQANYGSPGFNAGTYMSRKGVVTEEQLWRKAEEAAKARAMFQPVQDQPFLNYIMDTLPRRMAHVNTLLPELSPKPWARMPFRVVADSDQAIDAQGRVMPFIHWAGCGYPLMVRPEVFLHYRALGMSLLDRIHYRMKFYPLRWKRMTGNALRRAGLKK